MTTSNDSYQATGDDGGKIGFLNLSKHPGGVIPLIRGAPTGAVLYATKTGLKAMVGVKETDAGSTLLDNQAGEGYGVGGASNTGDGVIGVSSSDTSAAVGNIPSGVLGIHTGNGNGVTGMTNQGVGDGVFGYASAGGSGVHGRSSSPQSNAGYIGGGAGVMGENLGVDPGGIGVYGTSQGTNGTGVYGIAPSIGVMGYGDDMGVGGSSSGYGGFFTGGLAPLRLQSSNTQGSPTSGTHSMGELYVDNQGALYFCVASGTPGTWKTVQLV